MRPARPAPWRLAGPDYLSYELLPRHHLTPRCGGIAAALSLRRPHAPNKNARTYPIYGRIPATPKAARLVATPIAVVRQTREPLGPVSRCAGLLLTSSSGLILVQPFFSLVEEGWTSTCSMSPLQIVLGSRENPPARS